MYDTISMDRFMERVFQVLYCVQRSSVRGIDSAGVRRGEGSTSCTRAVGGNRATGLLSLRLGPRSQNWLKGTSHGTCLDAHARPSCKDTAHPGVPRETTQPQQRTRHRTRRREQAVVVHDSPALLYLVEHLLLLKLLLRRLLLGILAGLDDRTAKNRTQGRREPKGKRSQ